MPTIVAISSWTAASAVGLAAQLPAYFSRSLHTVAIPTTVLGVRPGLGRPTGGGPVEPSVFSSALDAALSAIGEQSSIWIQSGYFADADQVSVAATALSNFRKQRPNVCIAIDPVMGDWQTGLYVSEQTAARIEKHLIPLADVVLPNAWEAQRVTKVEIATPADAVKAASALPCAAVITSVPREDRLGAVYVDRTQAWFAHAPFLGHGIHGAGDHFTAVFVAERARGDTPREALIKAVASSHDAVERAIQQSQHDVVLDLGPPSQDDVICEAVSVG